MPTIGELIRQARKEKDMTQQELAEQLGVTESRVSAIEQDEEAPEPDQIREIEGALGLAPGKILDESGMIEGSCPSRGLTDVGGTILGMLPPYRW